MSDAHLDALQKNLEECCSQPPERGWDRQAAGHTAVFRILAEAADDDAVAAVLGAGAELSYHLMMRAGRAANGLAINFRRRFLEYLRLDDAEAAAQALEGHLRTLNFMCRLVRDNALNRT